MGSDRQLAELLLVFVHEGLHIRPRIGAEHRAIGDEIHVAEIGHAFQPEIAVPGFRAQQRRVDAAARSWRMALTPPGGNEQSTMKSGFCGKALMRVIWLAICGSSPPKVSLPASPSAPASSASVS